MEPLQSFVALVLHDRFRPLLPYAAFHTNEQFGLETVVRRAWHECPLLVAAALRRVRFELAKSGTLQTYAVAAIADAAIADAAIARSPGASFAIARQISRFWSFNGAVIDKFRTGLLLRTGWKKQEADRSTFGLCSDFRH
jgi:hypothetical protein